MELTGRLIKPGAAGVHRVHSRGRTTVERVFSLVLLGDLVSVYLAALRGVDPGQVESIDFLINQIAGQMNISSKTVEKKMSKALKRLRVGFGEAFPLIAAIFSFFS